MDTRSRLALFLLSGGILGVSLVYAFAPVIHGDFSPPPNTGASWQIVPALSLGFVGCGLLFWSSRDLASRLLATIAFFFFFYFYFFFYYAYGSDVGGILGSLRGFVEVGNVPSTLGTYQAWPDFYILCKEVYHITGLTIGTVLKSIFTVINVMMAIAVVKLFPNKDENWTPMMPAMVFLASCYTFLNWQAAPQTLGFAVFALFFGLLKRDSKVWVVGPIVCLFLISEHGFVSLWFIGVLVCYWLIRITRRDHSKVGHETMLLLFAVVAETAYLFFFAPRFLGSFARTIDAALNPSLATGAPIPVASDYLARSLPFVPGEQPLVTASKLVAIGVVASVGFLIITGLAKWVRAGGITRQESAFLSVGVTHIAAGSLIPLLGMRGIQLSALSLARAPGYNSWLPRKILFVIMVVLLLALPVNLVRINTTTTLYVDSSDLTTSNWFLEYAPTDTRNPSWLYTSSVLGGVIVSSDLQSWRYCGAHFPPPKDGAPPVDVYEISTAKYTYEVSLSNQKTQALLNATSNGLNSRGNLIFDMGGVKIYSEHHG